MKTLRSQSSNCIVSKKLPPRNHSKTSQQPRQLRQFSLTTIKNRTFLNNNKPLSQLNRMNQFKQKILQYIDKRSDVEIINFYNEYKEQFFRKSINLQNLFYQQPQTRQKYLNQEDTHFYKGFQHTLLTLFRKGLIVPGEYKNMRLQTVQQIEKWVFSWIKRKNNYQKATLNQQIAQTETLNVVGEISSWAKLMKAQKPFF